MCVLHTNENKYPFEHFPHRPTGILACTERLFTNPLFLHREAQQQAVSSSTLGEKDSLLQVTRLNPLSTSAETKAQVRADTSSGSGAFDWPLSLLIARVILSSVPKLSQLFRQSRQFKRTYIKKSPLLFVGREFLI